MQDRDITKTSDTREMYAFKTNAYRECKSAARSYPSKKEFIKDLTRRRDKVRILRTNSEMQTDVLRGAESALTAQIAELTKKIDTERTD